MVVLLAFATSVPVRSQTGEENSAPILIDEFASVTECDFKSRLDSFLTELSQKPDFHGYVINYKGADELPDLRDSNSREAAIASHIEFRNFDRSRITLMRGGYRTAITTELWIVAPGVNAPEPSKTVASPKIPEHSTFLFAKNSLEADGEESSLDDYVLSAVKEREAAEFEEMNRQSEAEQPPDATEAAETSKADEAPSEPSEDAEPYVDQRTDEEKDAEKLRWADVGVAKFIAERKGSTGVIIFYADDERYDIEKLRGLLETGRDRLAEQAGIKRKRLKIGFGGYRGGAEAEFWFVPAKGKAPRPKPEERPLPKSEEAEETADPRK